MDKFVPTFTELLPKYMLAWPCEKVTALRHFGNDVTGYDSMVRIFIAFSIDSMTYHYDTQPSREKFLLTHNQTVFNSHVLRLQVDNVYERAEFCGTFIDMNDLLPLVQYAAGLGFDYMYVKPLYESREASQADWHVYQGFATTFSPLYHPKHA